VRRKKGKSEIGAEVSEENEKAKRRLTVLLAPGGKILLIIKINYLKLINNMLIEFKNFTIFIGYFGKIRQN
jgi:hypothetical protein